jgi:hypothetical protein
MSTLWRTVQASVAIVLPGAGAAMAQDVPRGLAEVHEDRRAGFWVGLGVGAGGESFDPRDGSGYTSELYRPTVSLRLGGTVSQGLRLGGEVLAWIDEERDAVHSLSSFLFIGQLYPVSNTGLYLKGGAGLGRSAVDFDDGSGLGDTGFAGLLGAGWELRVGRNLYLNPAVDLVEHRYTARGGERYRERLVNFGLGVLFQSAR